MRGSGSPKQTATRQNSILDHPGTRQNIRIPKTQYLKTLAFQKRITPGVAGAFRMLGSIRLDNEAMRETDEIRDIGRNRRLAAELQFRHTPVTQDAPERGLGFRWLPPHVSGVGEQI
jgi:hypothetical protein